VVLRCFAATWGRGCGGAGLWLRLLCWAEFRAGAVLVGRAARTGTCGLPGRRDAQRRLEEEPREPPALTPCGRRTIAASAVVASLRGAPPPHGQTNNTETSAGPRFNTPTGQGPEANGVGRGKRSASEAQPGAKRRALVRAPQPRRFATVWWRPGAGKVREQNVQTR